MEWIIPIERIVRAFPCMPVAFIFSCLMAVRSDLCMCSRSATRGAKLDEKVSIAVSPTYI